jgi:hypothetical protein
VIYLTATFLTSTIRGLNNIEVDIGNIIWETFPGDNAFLMLLLLTSLYLLSYCDIYNLTWNLGPDNSGLTFSFVGSLCLLYVLLNSSVLKFCSF